MRRPSVAGQFYPGDGPSLRRQIEQCFTGPLGPGSIPKVNSNGQRKIIGGIAPHAGYVYSGMVAAHLYSRLAEDGLPESFVIIGPNHTGMGSGLAITTQDFETPLGVARIDLDLARQLREGLVDDDPQSHSAEHSIEVQLPFLQYLTDEVKFVPVCMGFQDLEAATSVGNSIRNAMKSKDIVVIASTDFSHYVSASVARKKDTMALDAIKAMDPRALHEVVRDEDISMCGYGPVMTAMVACAGGRSTLLKYANSGDVHPMHDVVGYAAAVIEK